LTRLGCLFQAGNQFVQLVNNLCLQLTGLIGGVKRLHPFLDDPNLPPQNLQFTNRHILAGSGFHIGGPLFRRRQWSLLVPYYPCRAAAQDHNRGGESPGNPLGMTGGA
jgi:hypothetical protein